MSELSPDLSEQPRERVESTRLGGLFGRVAVWIGLGFVCLMFLFISLHTRERMVSDAAGFAVSVVDRTALIARLTNADPALLRRLSDNNFRLRLATQGPTVPEHHERWDRQTDVRRIVDRHLATLNIDAQAVPLWFYIERGVPRLTLALPQAESALWIVADARAPRTTAQRHSAGLIGTLMLSGLVFAGMLWGARRVTRHLPKLVQAAEQLGRGEHGEPLPVEGPKEIQRARIAFNRMLARIQAHERQRSAMLGAFSHDIRTLSTRLRLRVERISDDDQRNKALQDLHAVTRIVDEAMAYSRDEASAEPRVDVELRSLLGALLDDAADAQALDDPSVNPVTPLNAGVPVSVSGQPVALRRAFGNLIDNALLYGGGVSVRLHAENTWAVIQVSDPGPGIAPEDQQRVLEPYVRLESSRNRDTGGTGLGLAIVNNVVTRHGGRLSFKQDDAGFHVQVCLPLT